MWINCPNRGNRCIVVTLSCKCLSGHSDGSGPLSPSFCLFNRKLSAWTLTYKFTTLPYHVRTLSPEADWAFMALLGLAWKPPWAGAVSAPLKAPYLSFRSVSQLPPFPPPFPVINTCPSPTCSCAATPGGLDIDHARPLSGTMPAYNQHVVICTGQDDWPSRIEDDTARGFFAQRPLARLLKNQLGPKGPLHNVSRAVKRYSNLGKLLMT